jgi:hypothetical protein
MSDSPMRTGWGRAGWRFGAPGTCGGAGRPLIAAVLSIDQQFGRDPDLAVGQGTEVSAQLIAVALRTLSGGYRGRQRSSRPPFRRS